MVDSLGGKGQNGYAPRMARTTLGRAGAFILTMEYQWRCEPMTSDLLIKGGIVHDGTGAPARRTGAVMNDSTLDQQV